MDVISIHAPREGSDISEELTDLQLCMISIHAPREGSDRRTRPPAPPAAPFLSTLPVRGATLVGKRWTNNSPISIHAPREGSDSSGTRHATPAGYFYPRSP